MRNSFAYPVYFGVMSGQPDFLRIDVDGDDVIASLSELDGVAANSAEGVNDDVAATPLGDVLSDSLRGHGKPGLHVKLNTVVEPRKQVVPEMMNKNTCVRFMYVRNSKVPFLFEYLSIINKE